MAKKMGDAILATTLLAFLVTAFAVFIIGADNSVGITSQVQTDLSLINTNVTNNYQNTELDLEQKVSNTTVGFEVLDNTFIDKTGRDEASLMKDSGRRTLVVFVNDAATAMKLHPIITSFAISVIIILFIILLLRMFIGEGKV